MAWLEPCGIPIDPDGATRPRARPLFPVVGTRHLFGILAKKGNPGLQIQHVWLSHFFGVLARALPKFKYLTKREHVVRNGLTHANVPAVVLANVNGKRIRTHNYTYANVAIAEEHPVEE